MTSKRPLELKIKFCEKCKRIKLTETNYWCDCEHKEKIQVCLKCKYSTSKKDHPYTNLRCVNPRGKLFSFSSNPENFIGVGHEEPKCKVYEHKKKERKP